MKDELLDGYRVMEDITYADSFQHEILAMNDGSYIMIMEETEVLFGEAYLIKDGCAEQICKNGKSVVLKGK